MMDSFRDSTEVSQLCSKKFRLHFLLPNLETSGLVKRTGYWSSSFLRGNYSSLCPFSTQPPRQPLQFSFGRWAGHVKNLQRLGGHVWLYGFSKYEICRSSTTKGNRHPLSGPRVIVEFVSDRIAPSQVMRKGTNQMAGTPQGPPSYTFPGTWQYFSAVPSPGRG
jgi:hypothetical protein